MNAPQWRFEIVGRRKRYYEDNGEDALLMSVDPRESDYAALLAEQRALIKLP